MSTSGLPQPIDITSLSRRLTQLARDIEALAGARRLASATISSGGLTVAQGGDITLRDGGDLSISDGGGITIQDGGALYVNGPATVRGILTVADGGQIRGRYPNGAIGIYFGRQVVDGQPSGYGLMVNSDTGKNILVAKQGADGRTAITLKSQNSLYLTGESNVAIQADDILQLVGLSSFYIRADPGHRLYTAGNDLYLTAPTRVGVIDSDFYVWGNLGCSGTKPFIIEHPLDPDLALTHAATESPVAGLEYWGDGIIGEDGTTQITLPDYFEALAAADWRGVQVTPYDTPVPLAASRVRDGAFTVTGLAATEFSWVVKARRGDPAGQFETVRTRQEAGLDQEPPPEQAEEE